MIRKTKRYGWKPQLPDHRDLKFGDWHIPATAPIVLPPQIDLRPGCPPVYDQGDLGSCTANAIAAAVDFEEKHQGRSFVTPSRLFIYYNERAMEGDTGQDNGAQIRDGMKSIDKQGVCPETEWPYDPSMFAYKPLLQCYNDALKYRAINYFSLNEDLTQMRQCLASGFPFVFGFTVYESFESSAVAASGIMPMPGPNEGVVGGHAVMACGYDDDKRMVLVRNSWGPGWGLQGYFWMPYDYLFNQNLASDFWVIQKIA